ncbi:MAG TPA: hypothetical protein V6C86_03145 [Oculatellaceae cyanobacterium]
MTKTTSSNQSAQSQSSDASIPSGAPINGLAGTLQAENLARGESTECVVVDSGAIFKGTQEFVVTRTAINLEKAGTLTKERIACLEKVFRPSRLFGRTVLDLAPQPGFFTFLALQNGAKSVKIVDKNQNFLEMLKSASKHVGFDNLQVECKNPRDLKQSLDIVLALNADSYIHEFGDNAKPNDYEAALESLSKLTNYVLIVESPSFGTSDTDGNSDLHQFELYLSRYFKRVEFAGEADARAFYLAFNTEHDVDLRCPLPDYECSKDLKLLSCRQLTESAGLQFWSRVYAGSDAIYKQATRELIEREKHMLEKLDSDYFPRIKGYKEIGTSSVLTLEKIDGSTLPSYKEELTRTKSRFLEFAKDCFNILLTLQNAGIQHRDIQPNNFMLRNGKPVLIDFGWAVTDKMPMLLPAGLLTLAPDGQACDAYAIGLMLCDFANEKFPELLSFFELMTEADPSVRITDANDLLLLFNLVTADPGDIPNNNNNNNNNNQTPLIRKLMASLKISRTRLVGAQDALASLENRTMIEKDHRLAILEMEYEKVVTEINKVISELKRVIGEKDELLELLDERQKLIEGITQSQAWRLANQLQKSKKSLGSMFGKSS